jgi:hypothetical protein
MARPKKHTVDYFPHDCYHSKEIEILIDQYGNAGYAFYYRLMEVLGRTPYYTIDYSDTLSIRYLSVHTGTKIEVMTDIINSLVDLNVFDRETWEQNNHIWCQSFVDSIEDVYKKRTDMVPYKYSFIEDQIISGAGNEQSKLNQRKRKKEKERKEANNEKMMTVYCPNEHGEVDITASKIGHIICGKCEEVLVEKNIHLNKNYN